MDSLLKEIKINLRLAISDAVIANFLFYFWHVDFI